MFLLITKEKKSLQKIYEYYANMSWKLVSEYIEQCERCTEKLPKKEIGPSLIIKPITVSDFNDRAQIDLVNFQTLSGGKFKYILHYQKHLSKYHILKPLTSKHIAEVAFHLVALMDAPDTLKVKGQWKEVMLQWKIH